MAKRPAAGRMRLKVLFQRRATGDDGYGNTVSDFATVFTDAAEFTAMRGGEAVQASRLTGTQPYIVFVRNFAATRAVTTAWRIVDERQPDRIFNIRSIADPDGKSRWLEMLVEQGVAD